MRKDRDRKLQKPAKRVFISYRRADTQQAYELRGASEAIPNLELVVFPDDQSADGDWRAVFRSLIRESDGLVCLVGPTTASSSNIAWELDEATKEGIPILLAGRGATALARLRGDEPVETVEDVAPKTILTRLQALV